MQGRGILPGAKTEAVIWTEVKARFLIAYRKRTLSVLLSVLFI